MRRLAFCIAILWMTLPNRGHSQTDREALRAQFVEDSVRLYKPKRITFDLIFDNRQSFIRNKQVDITGYNIGLIFNRRFRIGAGYYEINRDVKIKKQVEGSTVRYRDMSMQYGMLNFEYWLLNTRRFEIAVPVEIGFGSTNYTIKAEDNATVITAKSGLFIPSGIGLQVKYKPIRWAGVNGLIGYRKSLKTYDINADFDGMFYSYGVSVFIGNIITDLRYLKLRKNHRRALAGL